MTFFFLDQDETVLGVLNSSEKCLVNEVNFTAEFSFQESSAFSMDDAAFVGFADIDNNLVFYELGICTRDSDNPCIVSFSAEHAAMSEMLQQVIEGRAVTGATAGFAVSRILEGSRWTMLSAENTPVMSTTFYFRNRWDCLEAIVSQTGCALYFTWTITGNRISARNVIVKARAGTNRGKRFDLNKDIANIHVEIDKTSLYTRLYGRGKGEEVGENDSGETTYGRRIDFGDVIWDVSDGDPINKPSGQLYLEDTAATEVFGRGPAGSKLPREGIVVFPDCEDPDELIQLTYEKLLTVRYPILAITAKVRDLERVWGYSHEAIRRGDDVLVIADEWNATYQDRIVGIVRDYNDPLNTEITIGTEGKSITALTASLTSTIQQVKEQAEIGSNVAASNPSLLQGIIDTMATVIMSSGTNMSTDTSDGSLIFTASDGTSAMKLTGNGLLISNQRTGNTWIWKTAINGSGIATGELTTGTINASLIRILGTNQFYWDASNIYILNPSDTDQQIRIGLYDGTNYGIAYTTDGGATWQNAIGFDGVHFSASAVISAVLNSAQYTADMNSKADAQDLEDLAEIAIVRVVHQFYLSTSATQLSGDTWHDTAPIWQDGKYMWMRTVVYYSDDSSNTPTPVCIAGATGQDGQDGTDGVNGNDGVSVDSIVLQYYKSSSATSLVGGSWGSNPPTWEVGWYIWTRQLIYYSDNLLHPQISDPICVTGSPGQNGTNGTDGISTYTYIRYSPYSDGSNFTQNPDNDSLYIGLAVTSSTTAPTSASSYTWSRYVGQNGANGTNGTNGASSYTYIRYSANANGNPMTTVPGTGSKYIGICVTTLSTAPTSYNSYTWSKYAGDDGQDGADGTSVTILGTYNSLADLQTAHPTGNDGDAYIIAGDLYVWSSTDSDWVDVGTIQGPAGQNGASSYTFIRYSANADGSNMTTVPDTSTLYIGICVTSSSTAPTNAGNYTWSRYVGEDGQGGRDAYMYVRYSANASGQNMTTSPTSTTKYIGFCSTASSTAPTSYSDYTWSKYVGENGNSVSSVTPYYAKGSSASVAPSTPSTTGWAVVAPTIGYGEYLWCSYRIVMTNGDTNFTTPFMLNGADQVTQGSSAPASPVTGMLWLDISDEPMTLKRYDGSAWIIISDYSGQIQSLNDYVDQVTTSIQQQSDSIQLYVQQNTVAQSDYAVFTQAVKNILQMDPNGTTMLFQRITEEINSVNATQAANYAEILKYIRFVDGTIILGEEGNETTLKLENEILGFYQYGKRVAYFQYNRLYVDQLEAISSLRLGNYQFQPNTTGGMSLKYIG